MGRTALFVRLDEETKMRNRLVAVALVLALGVSAALFGCAGNLQPTDDQKKAIKSFACSTSALSNIGTGATPLRSEEILHDTYTMTKTSHGCYKLTMSYEVTRMGSTQAFSISNYYEDADSATQCPKASEHHKENL